MKIIFKNSTRHTGGKRKKEREVRKERGNGEIAVEGRKLLIAFLIEKSTGNSWSYYDSHCSELPHYKSDWEPQFDAKADCFPKLFLLKRLPASGLQLY